MKNDVTLSSLSPSEILEPSSLETYEETLNLIWQQLVRLNSILFIMDKLLDFRSDLFLGLGKETFLTLVKISLSESSLLIISKLTTDTGTECLSIRRFKNWVREQVKEEYREALDRLLKQHKFDKAIQTTQKKIKDIRDNFIAHLTVDENLHPKIVGQLNVSLQEVRSISEELNRLFNTLCFGIEHSLLPLEYNPAVQHPVGVDSRSDVEHILDLLVQDSAFFKMIEEPSWEMEKEVLSPEIIEVLNQYRRKFGKSEV